MCKFHLLGCCQDGENCAYAHAREEMQTRPDLFRTKLCKALIKNGECTDPNCKFAHNKEELRSSGTLRRSLATPAPREERTARAQESKVDAKAVPQVVPQASVAKSAPMMRPVFVMPPMANMQLTGTASSSLASPGLNNTSTARRAGVDGRSTLELSASNKQSSSNPPKKELKKLELKRVVNTSSSNLGMNMLEQQLQYVEADEESNDGGMQEKWATLQASLAQHQERIQRHCDEVHALVMQRAGVDPQYRQLKRLQIPPIKAHSVSSNSAAVLEHISNTFERITILEAYIRAHGDLITNVPVSSGANDPLKVERGIEVSRR